MARNRLRAYTRNMKKLLGVAAAAVLLSFASLAYADTFAERFDGMGENFDAGKGNLRESGTGEGGPSSRLWGEANIGSAPDGVNPGQGATDIMGDG